MRVMIAGVKAARRALAASVLDPYCGVELQRGEGVRSDQDIADFIRAGAETIYHPVGTCRMGHDDMGWWTTGCKCTAWKGCGWPMHPWRRP